MRQPTKDDERRILGHVANVSEMIEEGSSPNDAIIKVASEHSLPPWQIRLIVNACNNGRSIEQRASSTNLFDKVAEFPLADPAVILKAIYPEKIKTASEIDRESGVSEEYDYAPDWASRRKRASAPPADFDWDDEPAPEYARDPARFDKKIRGGLHKLSNERDRLYAQLDFLHDKVASAYDQLEDYFRRTDAAPFEDVYSNASAYWGMPAEKVLDKMATMCGGPAMPKPVKVRKPAPAKNSEPEKPRIVKKAFVTSHAMRLNQAPYQQIDGILKTAAEYDAAFAQAEQFEKEAFTLQLQLERALAQVEVKPLDPDPQLSVLRRLNGEKRAFAGASTIGEGAKFMLGAEAAKSIMKKLGPKSDSSVKDDAFADVTDPSHENKLRSIRAQAALHGILNSPYFEGEDPNRVTGLFNDLTQMYPRMAEQPLLLETAMKRLSAQGSADTHDLDQLLGIETKLKQRDALPTGTNQIIETIYPKSVSSKPRAGSAEGAA